MKLNDGLVFASDTRTNAGVDYVTSYRKMHVFDGLGDRLFVLLTAGNLGVTQEVVHRLHADLEWSNGRQNLRTFAHGFEVAAYVGRVSQAVQRSHAQAFNSAGIAGGASMLFGGQIQGRPHELFLIYPQGNFIETSTETPYLQIGETKYGKPVLDRLVTPSLPLADAGRLALVSLDATIRSNATVGPPFDLAIYESNCLQLRCNQRLEASSEWLAALRQRWSDGLAETFRTLPPFDWEPRAGR